MKGVVLMGGQSRRMGRDKATISIEQSPLYQHIGNLLQPCCDEVYYSINPHQAPLQISNSLVDQFDHIGPLGGILTCLKSIQQPILFVAVDLPMLQSSDLLHLQQLHQKEDKITSYRRVVDGRNLWEGLVSIWEPSVLLDLNSFVHEGGRSVQQFLNQIGANPVSVLDEKRFLNVNRPEDVVEISSGFG